MCACVCVCVCDETKDEEVIRDTFSLNSNQK